MAACVVGAGAALAVSGTSQVVTSCVNATGVLRIVSSSQDCLPTERPLSWNQRGEPGATGPQGPAGVAGPPGPGADFFATRTFKATMVVEERQDTGHVDTTTVPFACPADKLGSADRTFKSSARVTQAWLDAHPRATVLQQPQVGLDGQTLKITPAYVHFDESPFGSRSQYATTEAQIAAVDLCVGVPLP